MKNQLIGLLVYSGLIFSACENIELGKEIHTGKIEGLVYLKPEASSMEILKKGAQIRLEGINTVFETETDTAGHYVLENIPEGNYNLMISKIDYGEKQLQNLDIKEDESLNNDFYLSEKSTTLVKYFTAQRIGKDSIQVRAKIEHNIRIPYYEVGLVFYLHTNSNLSNYENTQIYETTFMGGDHFFISIDFPIEDEQLKTASEIYIVGYGYNASDSGYYDFTSDKKIHTTLGEASDIVKLIK